MQTCSLKRRFPNSNAVEVAHGRCGAKMIALLGPVKNARSVLMPELVARMGQSSGGSVDHVHCAGVKGGLGVARGPDGHVLVSIAVEIAKNDGGTAIRQVPLATM